jgi:hypothetical protein
MQEPAVRIGLRPVEFVPGSNHNVSNPIDKQKTQQQVERLSVIMCARMAWISLLRPAHPPMSIRLRPWTRKRLIGTVRQDGSSELFWYPRGG